MSLDQTSDDAVGQLAGWSVLHLFAHLDKNVNGPAVEHAIKSCTADDHQVLTGAMLGHKADLAVIGIGPSTERLRVLQSELIAAGCSFSYSYLSLTELSEYSLELPDSVKLARLRPQLPPVGMPVFCFYPMSKRRLADENWYELDYEARMQLMKGHGQIGRQFAGRVLQLVTGSTGLDDYEWGVTLFGRSLEDLKECVYTMRFDEASYRYAEFGPFLTGLLGSPHEVLVNLGALT